MFFAAGCHSFVFCCINTINPQWGKNLFKILPLKKTREVCNVHHKKNLWKTECIKNKSRKSCIFLENLFVGWCWIKYLAPRKKESFGHFFFPSVRSFSILQWLLFKQVISMKDTCPQTASFPTWPKPKSCLRTPRTRF